MWIRKAKNREKQQEKIAVVAQHDVDDDVRVEDYIHLLLIREREREGGCDEQVVVDEVQYAVEDHHLVEFEGQDKEKAGSSVGGVERLSGRRCLGYWEGY